MKISKRILGVALAIIMIFNVFAIGTFAAYTGDAAAKLLIKTDKDTYAPGEEVTISFGVHSKEAAGKFSASGGWAYGYNTKVLEFCSTSDYNLSTGAAAHGFNIDASQTGFVGPMSQIVPNATVVGESITAGYDWDAIGFVSIAGSDGFVDTISNEFYFFSFKMKVKEDAADGTYTIGYNPDCYGTWYAYNSSDVAGEGSYGDNGTGTDYDFGTATFKVSSGPSVKVNHEGTQSKWANGTPVIEDYLFGFVGSFTGLEVLTEKDDATGKNEVTNIASIVAVATLASGGNASSTVNTIWKSGDKYMFRAAFEGFDPTGDEVVSVEFTVTMKDGATYKTDAASTKAVKDIYAASVALNPGLTPLA